MKFIIVALFALITTSAMALDWTPAPAGTCMTADTVKERMESVMGPGSGVSIKKEDKSYIVYTKEGEPTYLEWVFDEKGCLVGSAIITDREYNLQFNPS